MMKYQAILQGTSRAFPDPHPLFEGASSSGDVLVLAGADAAIPGDISGFAAVLVEIDSTCLTGRPDCPDGASNILGFARWRLGDLAPSNLVELVKLEVTSPAAIAAARAVLENAGFEVSLCADRIGRIVDRLIRPQFNLALNSIDDGLTTPGDLDEALKLGLGYRRGVLAPLMESGLAHHCTVTAGLFETYGLPQYAPARAAIVSRGRAGG